jgi:hypothetical protein
MQQPFIISVPHHEHVRQNPQQSAVHSHLLKHYLVMIGLRALHDGDMARVHLITDLIRAGGLSDA